MLGPTVRGPATESGGGGSQNRRPCLQSRRREGPGLELPIDHFRLLGVSPATDGQTVLRTLQQRLDRAPDQGFTHETLQARADLLRNSADLLSDDRHRTAYEAELTALIAEGEGGQSAIPALEIPNSKEVGGLLLLLEAGQAQEAFEKASRGLQPPQAPALGSSREADLALLAGLACQGAAEDYRQQRRYEAAARVLQQGLQLLQRMGQQPEQRRRLDLALDALLPYRVLDLLSRDLSASLERNEGLQLLEQLVRRRGGLEGESDAAFPASEFQPFFKQIRQFLTAQEQVDLFSRWAEAGSPLADFLASIALTASGFAQRKPERLQAAYGRLAGSGQAGVEPFLACQLLLLGQIEPAQALFEQGADPALRQWANEQGEEPLAGLCAYCRDWLEREVLPGFRDIEADPDLEAWFADRDVQAYVEQQDRKRARSAPLHPPEGAAGAGAGTPSTQSSLDTMPLWPGDPLASGLAAPSQPGQSGALPEPLQPEEDEDDWPDLALGWPNLHWQDLQLAERWAQLRTSAAELLAQPPSWVLPLAVAVTLGGVGVGGWLALRPKPERGQPIPVLPAPDGTVKTGATPSPAATGAPKAAASPGAGAPGAPAPTPAPPAPRNLPLTVAEPSSDQLRSLLEAWLAAKAAVLAGATPEHPLEQLARSALVGNVESQRRENASRGESETVTAEVRDFSVTSQTPQRIEAEVTLRYSDARKDANGKLITSTPEGERRNTYVFARDGQTWHLAAFRASR